MLTAWSMTLQVNHQRPLSGNKSYEQVSAKENLEDLNEKLGKTFKSIEESAIGSKSKENFKGLFDNIDLNSNKLVQQ